MDQHGERGPAVLPTVAPDPVPAGRRRRSRGPVLTLAALVLVLLGGAALFVVLSLREDPIRFGGDFVVDPAVTLAEADRQLAGYVSGRGGVLAEDGRCWFERVGAESDDVQPTLLCGPALFVDGDPARSWLRFPLTARPAGGDVRLAVAALPVDPSPEQLADPDLLRRPDGGSPPEGSGGLQVPPPARAEPGFSALGPFPGVDYTAPAGPSRLAGPAAAVTVTGLAAPDRIGTGDAARRPAEGERFLAVTYEIGGGEGRSATPPVLTYQAEGAAPVAVPASVVAPGTTVEAVVSVPADAAAADLVVVDDGVEQRLSLLTGAPGAGNLQVLARTNRQLGLDDSRRLPGTLSAPGRVSAEFDLTVTVSGGSLQWFAGPDGADRPAGPDRALLVVGVTLAVPGLQPGAVPLELLSLRLDDGTVVRPVDLDDAADRVLIAFDVPADLTGADLVVSGSVTADADVTIDLGDGRLTFPVTLPAG
ncbi:hypothetical protein [uncultured Modestobacter sp.]|uniref:hypothetical protein n=1 Tax=uncultured Modestobacter sp. TaxID=380048 RepID=UPI00260AB2E5|nr:hypothetical protein [uncultured Modestobacter sp.]